MLPDPGRGRDGVWRISWHGLHTDDMRPLVMSEANPALWLFHPPRCFQAGTSLRHQVSQDGREKARGSLMSGVGFDFPQACSRTTDIAQAPASIPSWMATLQSSIRMQMKKYSLHFYLYPWSFTSRRSSLLPSSPTSHCRDFQTARRPQYLGPGQFVRSASPRAVPLPWRGQWQIACLPPLCQISACSSSVRRSGVPRCCQHDEIKQVTVMNQRFSISN